MAATMAVATNRSDPWNLPDASTSRIGGRDPFQLEAESFNLVFDESPTHSKADR